MSSPVCSSFRTHPSVLTWCSPQAAVWIAAPAWSSICCRCQPVFPWSSPQAAQESLLQYVEHLISPLLSPWYLQGCFSLIFFPYILLHSVFCPFVNLISQKCYHGGCWAQLCPTVGPLELSGMSCVQHRVTLASPHRDHSYSPCCPRLCHINKI